MLSPEKKATLVAISIATLLTVTKLFFGIISGSMAIISSAADSLGDMFVSAMNFFAIHAAESPSDAEHNYGHGKIEGLAALFEGLVIFGSGLSIIVLALLKLHSGAGIEHVGDSLLFMLGTVAITAGLVYYLRQVGRITASLIIRADTLHYTTDLVMNAGVIVSLGIVYLTGWHMVDALASIVIALYVLHESVGILREGFDMLMDRSLSADTVAMIEGIIRDAHARVRGFHLLRTRRSGKVSFVEFHLVLEPKIYLELAHDIADAIEARIVEALPGAHVTIHLDPHDDSMENIRRTQI